MKQKRERDTRGEEDDSARTSFDRRADICDGNGRWSVIDGEYMRNESHLGEFRGSDYCALIFRERMESTGGASVISVNAQFVNVVFNSTAPPISAVLSMMIERSPSLLRCVAPYESE